jgi:hypothetical protein
VSLFVTKRDGPSSEKSISRINEVPVEGVPSHLAIGDYVKTCLGLERNGFPNGAVFDPLEFRFRNHARLTFSPRLL